MVAAIKGTIHNKRRDQKQQETNIHTHKHTHKHNIGGFGSFWFVWYTYFQRVCVARHLVLVSFGFYKLLVKQTNMMLFSAIAWHH